MVTRVTFQGIARTSSTGTGDRQVLVAVVVEEDAAVHGRDHADPAVGQGAGNAAVAGADLGAGAVLVAAAVGPEAAADPEAKLSVWLCNSDTVSVLELENF